MQGYIELVTATQTGAQVNEYQPHSMRGKHATVPLMDITFKHYEPECMPEP